MIDKIVKELKEEFQKTEDWFKKEITALRGSRLSIEIFDNLSVDCYNSKMSLKEVANLSLVDSRTIAIEPWDKSLIAFIEKALSLAEIKGNVLNDGKRILFSIPVISQEDREQIVKILGQKKEQAKQSLRRIRDEHWSRIQEIERKGEISEDEKFKGKDELQKIIEKAEKKLTEAKKIKEKEIMS